MMGTAIVEYPWNHFRFATAFTGVLCVSQSEIKIKAQLLSASCCLAGISRWGQSKLLVVSKRGQRQTDRQPGSSRNVYRERTRGEDRLGRWWVVKGWGRESSDTRLTLFLSLSYTHTHTHTHTGKPYITLYVVKLTKTTSA